MKNDFLDMVITSPPYDNIRKYNVDEMSKQLYRTMKPGGVVVWINDQVKNSESGTSFKHALSFMSAGFYLHDTMIYEKNSSTYPASRKSNRYTQIFEFMFVFSKGKPKTANLICDTNWDKNTISVVTKRLDNNEDLKEIKIKPVPNFRPRNNIWKYANDGGFTKDKIIHKHPVPENLVKDHLISWSNEGDLIYDPFMGYGTTAKICILYNRKYIGSEISKEYIEIANERLNKY